MRVFDKKIYLLVSKDLQYYANAIAAIDENGNLGMSLLVKEGMYSMNINKIVKGKWEILSPIIIV